MSDGFGDLLRAWRRRAGLSQDALATRAGLGVRTVRGLETGERSDPKVGTVALLAEALELSGAERSRLFAAAGSAEVVAEPPVVDPVAAAVETLAHAVRVRWQREEEHRQVHDPLPLPVRWRAAAEDLRDGWANIAKARPGTSAPAIDLAGSLDEVVAVHRRVPSGRLVVLGRAGAGKTTLTTRFVLDLLATRAPGALVPVIFGLGSWNPAERDLRDWLTEQLVRDHPGLAGPGPSGSTLAAALVETSRVLPVLDGFDEIAPGLHRAALAAVNQTALPLVLTSRPDEYRAAVEATDVLTAAAAVELVDLTVDDVADYLPRTTRKATGWEPVVAAVRADPGSAVATVLTTPLMISLARRVYSDTPDHDPAELLDTERFPTPASIERHLLASFVPAVYQDRPGEFGDRAQHWLGYLAGHLSALGTHDLAWWRLGTELPRRTRALVVGVVSGIGFGLTDLVVERALLGVITLGSLLFFPAITLVTGVAFGLMYARVVRAQEHTPTRARVRLRGWSGGRWSRVRARARLGLLAGALLGGVYGVLRTIVTWLNAGVALPLTATLNDVCVYSAVFAVGAALALGVTAAVEAPQDIRSAAGSEDLLLSNRGTALVQLALAVPVFVGVVNLLIGLVVTVSGGVLGGVPVGWGGRDALGVTLISALGSALGALFSLSAWGQWLVFGRFWLPLTGRLPWRVTRFVDDAYRRGVLRRAGAVHQFRHARLQEHLHRALSP
ncbi:helix-turn-helix domain-containing protein [Actinokineospora pegani]|uniref:helix-turn-helix domain-containing protein n=1 Tax=Actinokineospora pegani TaxID=2654637 RepID=UPI0012EAB56F|nr:helix-turn-helix transcriptional regulator [Actinokineospora pegani]